MGSAPYWPNPWFLILTSGRSGATEFTSTLCLKKRLNFETVQLKTTRSDFDDIWQKYSEYSGIEFVCFSFHIGLPVITLSSLKLHTENNACVNVFISRPTCTTRSAAARSPVRCSKLSQLHQQPIQAACCPTFTRKLCYKLLSIVTFTERRHGLQGM